MMNLTNRVALVTGAGTDGIGQSVAAALAQAGARVLVHDLELARAEVVVAGMRAQGLAAHALAADFADAAQARQLVENGLSVYGRLDILVSAAAAIARTPFLDIPDEEFERILRINVLGTFAVAQQAARVMAAQRHGRIILVTSINQQKAIREQAHYCASKGALMQLAKTMALELAPLGVTCNLIAPGAVLTDLNRHLFENAENLDKVSAQIPMQRLGRPDDFGAAAVFLASDEARYVTGASIFIDGGRAIS